MEWREVTNPELSYKMRYDFCLLGYDRASGTIDFALRFPADGSHCERHRHLANTALIVLEGEQHLDDLLPDGTTAHRVRRAGEYSRNTGPEELAHMERGGDDGAVIFYSCQADDGRLFEFLDDDLNVNAEITIDALVALWEAGASSA